MVQYARLCGVRHIFSDAACAGSISGFNTLGNAGAECIAVLSLNTARTGSMSRTTIEGPNTAGNRSMVSSIEPRVQRVLVAQTSKMIGVLRVPRVLKP